MVGATAVAAVTKASGLADAAKKIFGTVGGTFGSTGAVGGAVSNVIGSTKGTCGKLPNDEQLGIMLARANPNDARMKRTRERFGRCDCADPYRVPGQPKNRDATNDTGPTAPAMEIYRAPVSVVGQWLRYDCGSAGPIRQSLANDVASLVAEFGEGTPAAPAVNVTQTSGVYVAPKTPVQEAAERAKEEVSTLPDRILGGILRELGLSAERATQPIAVDQAKRQVVNAIPWLVVGGVVAWLVFRKG